jgi:hypothetical protein
LSFETEEYYGEIITTTGKNKESKKQYDKIVISLKPEAKAVIKRWGQLQ